MGVVSVMPADWVIPDVLIYIGGALVLWWEQRRPSTNKWRSGLLLIECIAFLFLYASVFENQALPAGLYDYGRSIIMVGAVPLSVPVLEWLSTITSLRLFSLTSLPIWLHPYLVGYIGMLQDFTLDPVSVRQVHFSEGRDIGRWSWVSLKPEHPAILAVPTYNFPGWVVILGLGAVAILFSRKLLSSRPILATFSPVVFLPIALVSMRFGVARMLMWFWPLLPSVIGEWTALIFHNVIPLLILSAFFWKGKFIARLTVSSDWTTVFIPLFYHLVDIAFALYGHFYEVIPLQLGMTALHTFLVIALWYKSRTAKKIN